VNVVCAFEPEAAFPFGLSKDNLGLWGKGSFAFWRRLRLTMGYGVTFMT